MATDSPQTGDETDPSAGDEDTNGETVEDAAGETTESTDRANHNYYFETGVGYWVGTFNFELTDWRAFRADPIGFVNRLLVVMMVVATTLFGRAHITSVLRGYPEEEPAGVVTNDVRITKFGVTLYLLRERYVLHPDGRGVTVDSRERFGPVPFLFSREKAHPAEVVEGGERAIYYMPLLGTDWVGRYQVSEDGRRIESELTCPWATATEVIDRVG